MQCPTTQHSSQWKFKDRIYHNLRCWYLRELNYSFLMSSPKEGKETEHKHTHTYIHIIHTHILLYTHTYILYTHTRGWKGERGRNRLIIKCCCSLTLEPILYCCFPHGVGKEKRKWQKKRKHDTQDSSKYWRNLPGSSTGLTSDQKKRLWVFNLRGLNEVVLSSALHFMNIRIL